MEFKNLWYEWQVFLTDNRNHHPIRSISFEQFVIEQLAKMQSSIDQLTKLKEVKKEK